MGRPEETFHPGDGDRHVNGRGAAAPSAADVPAPSRIPSARVVIAGAHPLVLEGLAHVLRRDAGLDVVGKAQEPKRLIDVIRTTGPDLAILDIHPDLPGTLEVLDILQSGGSGLPVVLLGETLRDDDVVQAMRLGIRGLVSKTDDVHVVVSCVRTVLRGGTWLDPAVVNQAVARAVLREAAWRELAGLLTRRQLDVVRLAATGLTAREMAASLFITPGTLKVHLHHIYDRLGVRSRAGLLACLRARGVV